jgi:hypothetical protein
LADPVKNRNPLEPELAAAITITLSGKRALVFRMLGKQNNIERKRKCPRAGHDLEYPTILEVEEA